MSARKKFQQLKALSFDESQVLLSSVVMLPLIAVSLKAKGYKWTQAFLADHLPDRSLSTHSEDTQLKEAQQLARIVTIASSNSAYKASCLKKSLLIWWLLARRGIKTELRIGVNNSSGDFKAHAWVEYRGEVLAEQADMGEQFSAFSSLPENRS